MPELYARIVRIPGSSASIVRELRKGAMHTGGGGTAIPKRWGCATRGPWSTWRERDKSKKLGSSRENY